MRSILIVTNLFLTVFLLCSCSSKTLSPAEMIAAAEALDKKTILALNNLDIAAVMDARWNDPKLSILDEDEFFVGSESFSKMLGTWLKKLKSAKFSYADARNIVVGDLVMGQQKWATEIERKDGTRTYDHGLHSDVKAMRDGKWVIISETFVKLPSKPEALLRAVEGFEASNVANYDRKDADGFLSHYAQSEDLVVVDVGLILKGFETWKGHIVSQMNKKAKNGHFVITESHNLPVGDLVLGYGRWTYTAKPGAKAHEGNYTNVKARRGGKWVLIMDHYSEAAHPAKSPPLPRKK